MLRLHIRACQVTNEIIILLENGYADGAMARWRTLHEIATVAAVIAKFGDELAERYVHYQIVESTKALTAYEQIIGRWDSNRHLRRCPRKSEAAMRKCSSALEKSSVGNMVGLPTI